MPKYAEQEQLLEQVHFLLRGYWSNQRLVQAPLLAAGAPRFFFGILGLAHLCSIQGLLYHSIHFIRPVTAGLGYTGSNLRVGCSQVITSHL